MPEIRERFIELAMRPIEANLEWRMATRGWLDNLTKDAPDDGMANAVNRWEKVDAKERRFNWRRMVIVLVLLLTPLLFFPLRSVWERANTFRAMGMIMTGPLPSYHDVVIRKLDENGKLLIGDPALSELEQAEKLLQSDPVNPAYYAEYAGAHWHTYKRLPSDYAETAAKLDPDNAWFDFFAAGTTANRAVEKINKVKKKGDPPEWKILNETNYRRSLELLGGMRGKARCESYAGLMMRKRTALLPQETVAEQNASIAYLATRRSNFMPVLKLSYVISARARELGDSGDAERFQTFEDQFIGWAGQLVHAEYPQLIDAMVVRMFVASPLKNFDGSRTKLGLDSQGSRITGWKESLDRFEADRKVWQKNQSATSELIVREGSLIASLSLPVFASTLEDPPKIRPEDLAPMRYSEYSTISQISVILLWIAFLLVMLLVFSFRLRAPVMVRKVAERTMDLLRPSDWAWILGVGVVVPCVSVMLLTAFTPLGGRELSVKWAMMKSLCFMPAGQFLMLLALTMLLVVLLTRWRLRLRAGMFGYRGKDIPGWIAAMLLVVAIPGALYLPTYLSRYGFLAWVSIPTLWLAFVAVRALFGKKERVLPRLVVSNVLLVSLAVAVLCLAPMVWWFGHASESWFEKDRFMKLSAEAPGMTPYEYWATQAYHEDTRRMLGAD